jgi:enediyne polyketide synthase
MIRVDLTARDHDGQIVESWQGLQMRAISPLALPGTWPLALFVPYAERKLHDCFGTRAIELGVHTGTDDTVDRTAQAVSAAGGRPTKVVRRADGRPETADGDVGISASHHGSLTLAISARVPVACDIEGVTARDRSIWRDMLTSSRAAAAQAICDGYGEDFNTAATRIWCASECLSKLGRGSLEPIIVKTVRASSDDDLWVLLTAGPLQCATIATRLDGIDEKVVAGFIVDTSTGSNS